MYVAADQNIHLHCVKCAFESLVYDRFMNKYEKVTFRKWAKCEEQVINLHTTELIQNKRQSDGKFLEDIIATKLCETVKLSFPVRAYILEHFHLRLKESLTFQCPGCLSWYNFMNPRCVLS